MVLNNKPQMFTIYFPSNFFYPEVKEKWEPIIEKMRLPYQDLTDFMNAQIQSIIFPNMSLELARQGREQYEVSYPSGKELSVQLNKEITVTFKLTESYVSYFVWWDQIDLFLQYTSKENYPNPGQVKKPCWMEPFYLAFLSDAGLQLTEFEFSEITPYSMTDLQLSYAAQAAQYNTFSIVLHYNIFEVK